MAIFIGGYERTGTTLMQGIVCSDEHTFPVTQESKYLYVLVESYLRGIRLWQDEESIMQDYFDTLGGYFTFHQQLINAYFAHIKKRWGQDKVIVQKHPLMTEVFSELAQFDKDSRFIVMVRDPRDAIASQIKWQGAKEAERDINHYIQHFAIRYVRLQQDKALFGNRLLFVQYEKLLTETDVTMAALREFTGLELPIDPTQEGWQSKRSKEISTHSPLDNKSLSPTSIGKHAEILTEKEINTILEVKDQLNQAVGLNIFWN